MPLTSAVPGAPAGVALPGRGTLLFIAAVVTSLSGLLLVFGDPIIASVPLLLVLGAYLFTALPLRVPLFGLVFFAALCDSLPIELPGGGLWEPPLYPMYSVLFENLNKVFPVEALRFSAVDLLYVLSLLLLAARALLRIRVDRTGRLPATSAVYAVVALAFVGVVWLEVWGVGVRGGDFRQSLWQIRQLLWLPTVTVLFVLTLRGVRDFDLVLNLIIAASCLKLVSVVWFYVTVARPMVFEPATLTSHYDSILFSISIATLVSRYLHTMRWRYLVLLGTVGLWIMLGVVLNNRRLCFVNIAVSLFMIALMLRGPMKRAIIRYGLLAMPLAFVYVSVGQVANSKVFKPAKLVMSVVKQDDRSSSTRDVENYNLLVTLKQSRILGSGWGHEYIEEVKGDDISHAYPQYRYMAHNGVLWLWSVGGLTGFTLLWMPLSIGIFLARRAYLFARTAGERSAAAMTICMMVTYMLQAWGDIGTQHLNSTLTLAVALAMSAKLAVSTGAVPRRFRFFGTRREDPPVATTVSWVGGVQ